MLLRRMSHRSFSGRFCALPQEMLCLATKICELCQGNLHRSLCGRYFQRCFLPALSRLSISAIRALRVSGRLALSIQRMYPLR